MVAVVGLATAFVMSWNIPALETGDSVTTGGCTVIDGSELVMVASPPLPPAAAVSANAPLTVAPPTSELGFRFTEVNVPPSGLIITCAEAAIAGSATEVAVIATVTSAGTVAGALYIPDAEIVPVAGVTDQVTAWSDSPVTIAVKAAEAPAVI